MHSKVISFTMALFLAVMIAGCDVTNVEYTDNLPPVIDSFNVDTPVVMIGDWNELSMDVTDPEEGLLTYFWDHSSHDTSDLEYQGRFARFKGYEDRAYTVRGLVDDGNNRVYQDQVIQVATFAESFNGLDAGTLPIAPWAFDIPNGQIKVTDGIGYGTGKRSLWFVDYGNPSTVTATVDVESLLSGEKASPVDEVVEFYIYMAGQDGNTSYDDFTVGCYDFPGTDLTDLVWSVRFGPEYIRALYENGYTKVARTPQAQWMKVKVFMDFDSDIWAMTINDKEAGDSIDMFADSVSRCDGLVFATSDIGDNHTNAGNYFIDNVVVTFDSSY